MRRQRGALISRARWTRMRTWRSSTCGTRAPAAGTFGQRRHPPPPPTHSNTVPSTTTHSAQLTAGVALADAQLKALDGEEAAAAAAVNAAAAAAAGAAAAAAAAAERAATQAALPAAEARTPTNDSRCGAVDAAAAPQPQPLPPAATPPLDPALLLARKALAENASLRAVHSKRSLARVVACAIGLAGGKGGDAQ